MVLEGFLSTDNLLGIIALLLTTLNFNQSRTKGVLTKIGKYFLLIGAYLKKDIIFRSKVEKKLNYVLDKMGVDIEALDAALNIDDELNLKDFNLDDLEGEI